MTNGGYMDIVDVTFTFEWRHVGIMSNHRKLDYLFSNLLITKKTSLLHITGFVVGIHQWLLDSPHKGQVTQKTFHVMTPSDPFNYDYHWTDVKNQWYFLNFHTIFYLCIHCFYDRVLHTWCCLFYIFVIFFSSLLPGENFFIFTRWDIQVRTWLRTSMRKLLEIMECGEVRWSSQY